MSAFKQSVSWWCFEKIMQPDDLLRACAEIGYAAVELVPQQYWPLVRRYGLEIASERGHGSLTNGLNRRENHDALEREIIERVQAAAEWGIPNVICFSGNRGGADDVAGAEATAEGLRRAAKAAEDAGVTLVLELLNSKVDHPDYQCDHAAWGVKVIEMVGSPNVRLLYDIYHAQVMEGDIIATIRQYYPYFGHYHTAGVPGRAEIDESQELYYPAIMKAIAATGYTGYVGQEFVPKGDPVAGLRRAYELCNQD